MKKIKRFDEGGETVYAEDLPEDYSEKMYSSTINRQAPAASKPAAKAVDRSSTEDKASARFKKNEAQNKKGSAKVALADNSYDRIERMRGMYPNSSSRGLKTPASTATTTTTKMKSGGSVSSASKRADGIATKGKTRGTMVMCGGGMMKGKK